ncbi:hypothetical protein KI387_031605, partial [Taxus chinensis]
FYEGIVQSYDLMKKKHTVLYDDGDVEVLKLQKERWEMIDGNFLSERPALTSESTKIVVDIPVKERTQMGDLVEKKALSSNKRRSSFPKSTKKGIFQSRCRDPFVFMDDKDQLAGGKKGKGKSGLEGRNVGRFTISTKITSGTSKGFKQTSTTADDEKTGSLSDSGARDSDDEPL